MQIRSFPLSCGRWTMGKESPMTKRPCVVHACRLGSQTHSLPSAQRANTPPADHPLLLSRPWTRQAPRAPTRSRLAVLLPSQLVLLLLLGLLVTPFAARPRPALAAGPS